MNYKLYWWIRKQLLSCVFFFKKQKFRHMEHKDTQLFSRSLKLSIAKTMLIRLALSSLLVCFIVGLDHILMAHTKIAGFDTALYKDLLLGGMGIAGVILGLYCANIASIFSAKYSNVPKQISRDFQSDIITKSSIKEIIGYIVTCTLTLVLCIAKIPLTWISLSIIAMLTIRVVIVFSISGTRTYVLSDTFRIADIHTNRINNALRKISKKNTITSDISFQHHIQKVCEKDISVLSEIAQYNLDIPATQNSSMYEFMENNLILIGRYWKIKNAIPHSSKWFADKTIYPQWHTASYTEASLAAHHSISINSKQTPNPWWFEDELLAVNEICLGKLIQDSDKPSIIKYLNKLAFLSAEAINANSTSYWVHHLNQVQRKTLTIIGSVQSAASAPEDELASIFDILASAYVAVLKSANCMLSSFEINDVLDHACTLQNNYNAETNLLQFFNNDVCDSLYRQISAEIKIEKQRITPDWFIKQTIAKQIYIYLEDILENTAQIIDEYINAGKYLHEKKLTYCAAVFFAHCFEIINNCEELVALISRSLPALEKIHVEKTYPWEKVTTQGVAEALSTLYQVAPALLVKNCGSFAIHNWNNREEKPDFLGLCYNHMCEHLIRSIEANDYSKFEALYCDFFSLTLFYQEYIRTNVVKRKEPHLQSAVIYAATEPYVEYGIISGLATLWGEFISDNRWRLLVQRTLEKFLAKDPEEKKNVLTQITQFVQGRRYLFVGITNRSSMQTGWETRVAHAMARDECFQFEYQAFGHKILKTDSKLLHAFAGSLSGDILHFHNTEDVFYVVFVNQYLDQDKKYRSKFKWEEDIKNDRY